VDGYDEVVVHMGASQAEVYQHQYAESPPWMATSNYGSLSLDHNSFFLLAKPSVGEETHEQKQTVETHEQKPDHHSWPRLS
jgi:hypothetical protein